MQATVQPNGWLPDDGKRTVNDLLDTWLETAAPSLKPRTIETYCELCDDHIRPAIGGLRLNRLTPDVVQRLIAPLQKQGKTRTVQKVYRVLHRAGVLAVLWGWLEHNLCDRIVKPKHVYGQREVWMRRELATFLERAREHPLFPLYLLLVSTGLHLGVPEVTPHGLHHLHASLLLAEGLPIPDVSRRLGHTSSAITTGIYAHAITRQDDAAVQAISKVITGKSR